MWSHFLYLLTVVLFPLSLALLADDKSNVFHSFQSLFRTFDCGHLNKHILKFCLQFAHSFFSFPGECRQIDSPCKNRQIYRSIPCRSWKITLNNWESWLQSAKNWIDNITHICCWNATGARMHYLMMQLADIFRMLLEYIRFTKRNEKVFFKPYIESMKTAMSTVLIDQSLFTGKVECSRYWKGWCDT